MQNANTVDRRCFDSPWPIVDDDGELAAHLHCGADGVEDPTCYPCRDHGYLVGLADAAYALGLTVEYLRSLAETAAADRTTKEGRYYLYRLIGADDRLLYVGITRNLRGRTRAHRRRWGDVIYRIDHEEYPDHRAVLAAEAALIASACPPFNHEGVGAWL